MLDPKSAERNMRTLAAAGLLSLLAGCIPMVLSTYEPTGDEKTESSSFCGWKAIKVSLMETQNARIRLASLPSGMDFQVLITITDRSTMIIHGSELKFESSRFGSPRKVQFGAYDHGTYRPVEKLVGPVSVLLSVAKIVDAPPPDLIISFPDIQVNDRQFHLEPTALHLKTHPAIVGLCQ